MQHHKKCMPRETPSSRPLAPDATSQLNILRHDSHTLSMNSAQVRVLEQPNQVCLGSLLQCQYRRALKSQIRLEILRDLTYQALERQLPDQQLRRLLVLANLPKRHRPGSVSVRLLHSAGGGRRFPGRLGSELLPGRLPSGRLASRLLSPRRRGNKPSTKPKNSADTPKSSEKFRNAQGV
ncbi:hypothetical protein KC19_VG078500 [Ceratodon purpureus]|uniref:Uncharacterized protein n=1 Tax=Ceratodon purpureus TaxID=3225 RepID=A0A8T0HN35_CERPU|nr:hypothetical protein KC19_VG078500 [Ceratodon purpureus]